MKNTVDVSAMRMLGATAILVTAMGCERMVTRPTPTPTPSPFGEHVVPAWSSGVAGVYRLDKVMDRTGTATVTVGWPIGDHSSLQLYLTPGSCPTPASLLANACPILGRSGIGIPPAIVSAPVKLGETNSIWIVNLDPRPTAVTIDLRIDAPSFHEADVTLSGTVFEMTPEGRRPIPGVIVANGEGNWAETDENGSYSIRPLWVCPCKAQPWVDAGMTFIRIMKSGYVDPSGSSGSVFGGAAGRTGVRDVRINGDTLLDVELVRTASASADR